AATSATSAPVSGLRRAHGGPWPGGVGPKMGRPRSVRPSAMAALQPRQCPPKRGWRFATNAAMPSRASSVPYSTAPTAGSLLGGVGLTISAYRPHHPTPPRLTRPPDLHVILDSRFR